MAKKLQLILILVTFAVYPVIAKSIDPSDFVDLARATTTPNTIFKDYFNECRSLFPKIDSAGQWVDKEKGFLFYANYNIISPPPEASSFNILTPYGTAATGMSAGDMAAILQYKSGIKRYSAFFLSSSVGLGLNKSGVFYLDSLVKAYDPEVVFWDYGAMLLGGSYEGQNFSVTLAIKTTIEPWLTKDSTGKDLFDLKWDESFSMYNGTNQFGGIYVDASYKNYNLGILTENGKLEQASFGSTFDLNNIKATPRVHYESSRQIIGLSSGLSYRSPKITRFGSEGDIGMSYTWYNKGPNLLYHLELKPYYTFFEDPNIRRDFNVKLKLGLSTSSDITRSSVVGFEPMLEIQNILHLFTLEGGISRNSYSMMRKVPITGNNINFLSLKFAW